MKFENAAGLLVSEIQIDLLFALRKTLKIGASGLLKTEINKVEKNYLMESYNPANPDSRQKEIIKIKKK